MKVKYLIIGTNAAGFYAIQRLREIDRISSIAAINGEVYLPYKRTKVNKNFYPDLLNIDNFYLAPKSWYKENAVTLINNVTILDINPANKTAYLDNGKTIHWEKLLLAVGAEPFIPAKPVFSRAKVIRTYDDALSIRNIIKPARKCLIYGLGILSVEIVVQLKQAGMEISLAGREWGILDRFFSQSFQDKIKTVLSGHDIPIHYGITIDDIEFDTSRSRFSINGDDNEYECMIHSLGIVPRTELAAKSGIKTEKGILVNEYMETSVPDIFASGDCCQHPGDVITDLWHSAQHQGQCAAANMAGKKEKYRKQLHRLKSDLFGSYFFSMRPFKKEIPEEIEVVESILNSEIQRIFYYRDARLQGVEMVGDKSRSKTYEKAVEEHWSREQVKNMLG